MKMIYDERETSTAKYMKNRTALGELYKQCISYGLDNCGPLWMDWMNAGDQFTKISYDYDHGVKFNQETLTNLYNMKLPENLLLVKRIIKLTRLGVESN